jgi:hypothetical protein
MTREKEATMNLHPELRALMSEAEASERRHAADRFRLRRRARLTTHRYSSPFEPVIVRPAVAADRPAIEELAALESKAAPAGRPLIAISGDRIEAVLDPQTGEVLADPFRPTARTVRLVRAYAESELGRAA